MVGLLPGSGRQQWPGTTYSSWDPLHHLKPAWLHSLSLSCMQRSFLKIDGCHLCLDGHTQDTGWYIVLMGQCMQMYQELRSGNDTTNAKAERMLKGAQQQLCLVHQKSKDTHVCSLSDANHLVTPDCSDQHHALCLLSTFLL